MPDSLKHMQLLENKLKDHFTSGALIPFSSSLGVISTYNKNSVIISLG